MSNRIVVLTILGSSILFSCFSVLAQTSKCDPYLAVTNTVDRQTIRQRFHVFLESHREKRFGSVWRMLSRSDKKRYESKQEFKSLYSNGKFGGESSFDGFKVLDVGEEDDKVVVDNWIIAGCLTYHVSNADVRKVQAIIFVRREEKEILFSEIEIQQPLHGDPYSCKPQK